MGAHKFSHNFHNWCCNVSGDLMKKKTVHVVLGDCGGGFVCF